MHPGNSRVVISQLEMQHDFALPQVGAVGVAAPQPRFLHSHCLEDAALKTLQQLVRSCQSVAIAADLMSMCSHESMCSMTALACRVLSAIHHLVQPMRPGSGESRTRSSLAQEVRLNDVRTLLRAPHTLAASIPNHGRAFESWANRHISITRAGVHFDRHAAIDPATWHTDTAISALHSYACIV